MQELLSTPRSSRRGLQIGNLVVEAVGDGPTGVYDDFEPRDPATLVLRTRYADRLTPLEGRLLFESEPYSERVDGDRLSLLCPDILRLDLKLPFSPEGELVFDRRWTEESLFYKPIDEFLFQYLLSTRDGILFHAAGIAAHGGGLLVVGVSGAGKTTMGRAVDDAGLATVLSDERVQARRTPEGWLIDGTPWPGEGMFMNPMTVPLRAVVFLNKTTEDRLEPISPGRALAELYRCHLPPLWAPLPALDLLEKLVREVPCLRLHNRLNGDGPRLLVEHLARAA